MRFTFEVMPLCARQHRARRACGVANPRDSTGYRCGFRLAWHAEHGAGERIQLPFPALKITLELVQGFCRGMVAR
jgi:hypothetical protein